MQENCKKSDLLLSRHLWSLLLMHVAPYASTDIYRGTERQAPASWGASYPIKIKTTKVIKRKGARQSKKVVVGVVYTTEDSSLVKNNMCLFFHSINLNVIALKHSIFTIILNIYFP